jgi:AcrR family transcriptional regulator
VFALNGVDGSSIRAIAKEAHCDPSLLYYHFENKEAIFVAILERKFSRFMPDLEDIASTHNEQKRDGAQRCLCNEQGRTPLQEALWQTLEMFHKHVKDDAGFRGMIRGSIATNQNFAQIELIKYVSRIIKIVKEYLRDGVESGELRQDMNLDTTTFFFIRTCVDILDFFPVVSARLMSMSLDEAIELAEKQWFQLFWAGVKNDQPQPPQYSLIK